MPYMITPVGLKDAALEKQVMVGETKLIRNVAIVINFILRIIFVEIQLGRLKRI